jgi:RimJ/RimL family protein N-acetyltransferase
MADSTVIGVPTWRSALPMLSGRTVALREPVPEDVPALLELLSLGDATRFAIDEPLSELVVQEFVERVTRERANGVAAVWAITLSSTHAIVGLMMLRQLDPMFEAADWECTLAPAVRGSGAFIEAARLVGSFAFSTLNTHRLEARVLLQSGRGNGALRKLGAVQEGVLRRSVRYAGEYFDQVLWSMLEEDWGDHWVSIDPRVH